MYVIKNAFDLEYTTIFNSIEEAQNSTTFGGDFVIYKVEKILSKEEVSPPVFEYKELTVDELKEKSKKERELFLSEMLGFSTEDGSFYSID